MSKYKIILFWLIPIVIFLAQAFFTYKSTAQIRYEEYQYKLVYYLSQKLVWDPLGAGDLGYYGTMYTFNHLFGFHFWGFKIFRLGLDLISLIFLALLLKRILGLKNTIIPLLTIGLSPTILFFNTLQVPYGIDLQYLPIILYLLVLKLKKPIFHYLNTFITFFLIMMAWLSYPVFVFYLPALAVVFITKMRKLSKNALILTVLIALTAFILPLITHIALVSNRDQLIDPENGQGLFKGAGTFSYDTENFYQGLKGIVINLFYKAYAYHYEVSQVDFSGILPAIIILLSVIIPLKLFVKHKEIRTPVLLCIFLAVINIILTSLTESAFNGFRRNTPLLASIYTFFVITYYLIKVKKVFLKIPKLFLNIGLSIILIHHIIVYPFNIAALKVPSPFMEYSWFEMKPTPKESYRFFQEKFSKGDLSLNCHDLDPTLPICNYTDLYSVLMSDCLWNEKTCHSIYGYLPGYNKYYKLTPKLLQSYDHELELPKTP